MFGDMLKKCRKILNMTQRELSNQLGIPQSKIAKLENNQQNPDQQTINKISNFFNVSIDFLFGREHLGDYFNLLMERSGFLTDELADKTGYDIEFLLSIRDHDIPMLQRKDLLHLGQALGIENLEEWLIKNSSLSLNYDRSEEYYFFDENNEFNLGRELTLKTLNNMFKENNDKNSDVYSNTLELSEIFNTTDFNYNFLYKGRNLSIEEIKKLQIMIKTLLE